MRRTPIVVIAAAGAIGAMSSALWWRLHRDERPYGPRWIAEAPRPRIGRRRLTEVLRPQLGEHLLEVGPGYGYYTLAVARALGPQGTLEILDLRETLLDQTMHRVGAEGLTNVHPTRGEGEALPYPDRQFDAAYLVATLGGIPDRAAAIHELARVLRLGGRLVVGETAANPHRVRLPELVDHASRADLRAGRKVARVSYFARFDKPHGDG